MDPSTGRDTRAYAPRRLTVQELEQYIQRKCLCSVCEFARAEIRAQLKDNSD